MGHQIQAIILQGAYDAQKAADFDLQPVSLGFGLTLFFIDHYYSACWQAMLNAEGMLDRNEAGDMLYPCDMSLYIIMRNISQQAVPLYAIIATDYFGGVGSQSANVYKGHELADKSIHSINQALRYLGVIREGTYDEFDTVGLYRHRHNPDYLHKYSDLADDLGV